MADALSVDVTGVPSVIGIGTDLVEVDRFRLALARRPTIEERLFSDAERAYSHRYADPTKHLAARFRREIGLPPKTVARMARFQGALAWSTRVKTPDWAGIAVACGYADQAHLTREFGEFAGASPAAWHRRAA